MNWSRRRLLRTGGALAGISAAALLAGPGHAAAAVRGRRIALFNLHTSERLEVEFFRDGVYVPQALAAIEQILRDFRTGERHAIDPGLLDYLAEVAQTLGVDPAFSVISGYRSAQTNARLHERSAGVAQHSLHMEGRAIDVRIAGVDCAALSARALDLKRGGVGYYRASAFVHLDTGRVRSWNG
jgi:uncharacterized protein YcbK (DUF882 family)